MAGERSNTATLFLVMDEGEQLFMFYIIDKPWDGATLLRFCAAVGVTCTRARASEICFPRAGNGGRLDVKVNATGDAIGYVSGVMVDLTLRDDVWNMYQWSPELGNGHFNWCVCFVTPAPFCRDRSASVSMLCDMLALFCEGTGLNAARMVWCLASCRGASGPTLSSGI